MKFEPLEVAGAFRIELEPHSDDRGFLARSWSAEEFRNHGLSPVIAECSISFNRIAGTLRGLHYQGAPHEEAKVVRCTRGTAFDVVVDLRPSSPSFKRHAAVTISAENRTAVYVPAGCAHGFETLEDATELMYEINTSYEPGFSFGVRWDDPVFSIPWPMPPTCMSDRDRSFADFAG
jgi:dTDP-4-dehydrorhamnose 3,5-epimerase